MIFISAGHHETAKGASYTNNSYTVTEYDLTVKWADLIASILGADCLRVPNGTLREKVSYINERCYKNDVAIEVHFNSFKIWKDANENGVIDDSELHAAGRGCETLYYPDSKTGKAAAIIVQASMAQTLSPDRGVKEGWFRMSKARGADFFLAQTKCNKSLIVEPEFIDNIKEINNNMHGACYAIASSLLEIDNA